MSSFVNSLTDTVPGVSLFEYLSASFSASFLPESNNLAGSASAGSDECKMDCGSGVTGSMCRKLCEMRSPNQMYGSGETQSECDAKCREKYGGYSPIRAACLASCSTGRLVKTRATGLSASSAYSMQDDSVAGAAVGTNFLLMLLFIAAILLAGIFSYKFNTILGNPDLLAKADPKVLKMCADLMVPTWLFSMTPFVNIGLAAGLSMTVSKLEASLKA